MIQINSGLKVKFIIFGNNHDVSLKVKVIEKNVKYQKEWTRLQNFIIDSRNHCEFLKRHYILKFLGHFKTSKLKPYENVI